MRGPALWQLTFRLGPARWGARATPYERIDRLRTKVTSCSHRAKEGRCPRPPLASGQGSGTGCVEEEGEDFWLFGALVTIKIGANDTAGQYSVMDIETPPGVGSPWHVHRDEDEWFYVHEGPMRGLHRRRAPDPDSRWVCLRPQGHFPHLLRRAQRGEDARLGGGSEVEGLLREIAEPAPEHVLPPPPEGAPDMDLLLPMADKWAYDILGPPGPPPGR